MAQSKIQDIMAIAPVIPVLVVDRLEDAVPMAEALVAGGLRVLEVTLRTPVAMKAIAAMKSVKGAIVGAGTVLNPAMMIEAQTAGAEFIVSPGLTEKLGEAAIRSGIPFLPGVANAGDIMRGLEFGLHEFKFFPAQSSGGIPALKALTGPFGQVKFCPTGGINTENATAWLQVEQVLCVGGSWIVPKGPLDPAKVEQLAAQAFSFRS